jgi:uncharacterized membrane protein YsdA (DUF1294 family)/cold shock CspA family protein
MDDYPGRQNRNPGKTSESSHQMTKESATQGVVERWEGERGFGFIRSQGTLLFFHVRDFRSDGRPPALGLAVLFERIDVGGKGPRAVAVRPLVSARAPACPTGASASSRRSPARQRTTGSGEAHPAPALLLMALYACAVLWAVWTTRLPVATLFVLPLMSVITFFAYWLDKDAARRRGWRTAESTLHGLSLLGGWPGAWWAQQLLRHKSVKPAFQASYWATVVLHIVGLLAWAGRASWWPHAVA